MTTRQIEVTCRILKARKIEYEEKILKLKENKRTEESERYIKLAELAWLELNEIINELKTFNLWESGIQ